MRPWEFVPANRGAGTVGGGRLPRGVDLGVSGGALQGKIVGARGRDRRNSRISGISEYFSSAAANFLGAGDLRNW